MDIDGLRRDIVQMLGGGDTADKRQAVYAGTFGVSWGDAACGNKL